MNAQIEFLAGDFRGQHAFGQVRDLVLRVEERAFRHQGDQEVRQILDPVAIAGADHEDIAVNTCFKELLR